MNTFIKRLCIGLAGAALCGLCYADELPYKEGKVLDVTAVRTKDGKFLDYWTFLSTSWRQEMDEAKKQGLIVSYQLYQMTPHSPQDPDVYIVVTYANYAAMDGLTEKMSVIDKKIWGSIKQAAQGQGDRGAIRTILGDEYIQELNFKN